MNSNIDFHNNKILFDKNRNLKKSIKKISGINSKNIELYKLAFIHKSASFYHNGTLINNERLEFLGDSVLGMVVAEFLYKNFPSKDEGFLSKIRSKIVNGQTLGELSEKTELDKLMVSKAIDKDATQHILGDLFEAFIGALYLDRGLKKTRKFIINRVVKKHVDLVTVIKNDTNYKSSLIEWAQKNKIQINFDTKCIDNSQPHNPLFETKIFLNENKIGFGEGRSKKEAEQMAAKEAINEIS